MIITSGSIYLLIPKNISNFIVINALTLERKLLMEGKNVNLGKSKNKRIKYMKYIRYDWTIGGTDH